MRILTKDWLSWWWAMGCQPEKEDRRPEPGGLGQAEVASEGVYLCRLQQSLSISALSTSAVKGFFVMESVLHIIRRLAAPYPHHPRSGKNVCRPCQMPSGDNVTPLEEPLA